MDDNNEKVVAVLHSNGNEGEEFVTEGTDLVTEAQNYSITNDDEYAAAGSLGSEIKRKAAAVTEFFKPLKTAAHQAHKQICDREKEVLKLFVDAEKIIKQSMSAYIEEQERKRREEEERIRQLAQQDIEKSIDRAAALEAEGKVEEAEAVMQGAMIAEDFQQSGSALPVQSAPKVNGVSTSKDYEIVSVDSSKVPVFIAGVEIRPVDLSAVKRLIKASKGTIKIDGIEYKEKTNISLRK